MSPSWSLNRRLNDIGNPAEQEALVLAPRVDSLPTGVAVALVHLVGCTPDPDEPGLWCWLLENARAVKPVPIRGRLGLFNVPLDLVEQL